VTDRVNNEIDKISWQIDTINPVIKGAEGFKALIRFSPGNAWDIPRATREGRRLRRCPVHC
jgi:hypothetical protein